MKVYTKDMIFKGTIETPHNCADHTLIVKSKEPTEQFIGKCSTIKLETIVLTAGTIRHSNVYDENVLIVNDDDIDKLSDCHGFKEITNESI